MKIRTFATLLGIAGIAGLAAPLEAATNESFTLESVSATVGANGRVTYQIAGKFYAVTWQTTLGTGMAENLRVSGSGVYDPASRRAQEGLVAHSGTTTIRTSASCLADPWLFAVSCTDSRTQASDVETLINVFAAPMTAGKLSDGDRQRVRAAFDKALADKNAADAAKAAADRKAAADKAEAERKARLAVQVGPIGPHDSGAKYFVKPNPYTVGVVPLKDPYGAAAKHALGTPTGPPRPQYPPYGAAYTSNAVLASLTVNRTVFVSVTVRSLSSKTWPAGGAFRLAYHWYRGGGEIVHDGARTFMPAAVAPGASVTLNAKVIAPPSIGVATLRRLE